MLYVQNYFVDNNRYSFQFSVITALNIFVHLVSHKSSLNFYKSCFPTTLSKSVEYYLEIIEAILLYIQAKNFHFSEVNASDFPVKASEKSRLYG